MFLWGLRRNLAESPLAGHLQWVFSHLCHNLSVLGFLGDLEDQGNPEVQAAQHLQGNHARLSGLVSPVLEDPFLLESP